MTQGNRTLLLEQLARYAYQWSPEKNIPLASGQMSDEYLDCKTALSRPETMVTLGPVVLSMLDRSVVAIGGLTMGADPIAMSACQASWATAQEVHWFSVRKNAKEHGLRKLIEGCVKKGDRVAVVDDVVTTGGSTIQAIEGCREFGLKVVQVIVLVDREQSKGLANVSEAARCPVVAICTKREIAAEWHRLNQIKSGLRATG